MAGLQVLKAVCDACGQRIHIKTHQSQKVVACPKCQTSVMAGIAPPPAAPACPRCNGFLGDRRGQSLACVDCGFQVGAPKIATAVDQSERPTPRPAPRPVPIRAQRRSIRIEWILSIAVLLVLAGIGYGTYWWTGQPSAAERQAAEDAFRTGEELMAMQASIQTDQEARRRNAEVMAKAKEHIDARMAFDTVVESMGERRKRKLQEMYKRRQDELTIAFARSMFAPHLVKVMRTETGEYVTLGGVGESTAHRPATLDPVVTTPPLEPVPVVSAKPAKTAPPKVEEKPVPKVVEKPQPKALDLEPIRRLVSGKWTADGLTFEIDAVGKGFVNHIVRNADSITGYLGDFLLADRDGKPTIAYTLSGSGGRDLPFLFRILPATTATELVLEEAEARMGKNPFVMRRPGAAPKPKDRWEVVAVEGDKTACVVCESGGFYSGYGGHVAITLSLGTGQATAKLDEPGSLWIVGKGGVTWKGVKLPEGSFAEIDRDGRAMRVVDKYRASVEVSKDADLLSKPAGGKSLARVTSGTRVQLLVPANDPKGLHQVRLPDGKEGWLAATWTEVRFERKVR